MRHQISLVGGQLLPVYLGIKEFLPDKLHLIVSPESKGKTKILKSLFQGQSISEHLCDPFNFTSVLDSCKSVLAKISPGDEVLFNLTGGTKVMLLAAQAIMQEKSLGGFYVNQNGSYTSIPSFKAGNLQTTISIVDFLAISGHSIGKSRKIDNYSKGDFVTAEQIFRFCDFDYRYKLIMKYVSQNYSELNEIPEKGVFIINKKVEVKWEVGQVSVIEVKKPPLVFKSPSIRSIFFNSGWWELVVASEVSKWSKEKELLLNVELPFKSDKTSLKNEIDILLNYNSKLIFIECKSGRIYSEDINKIKVIREIYGGVISKSLLVCFEAPGSHILEKCEELGIEVFYYKFGNIKNGFEKLQQSLNKVLETPNI